MSIEALFERGVVALEGILEHFVSERLERQRGGGGTPAHVAASGMVDGVIARRLDGKGVQTELEKLDRVDIIRELEKRGVNVNKKWGDKRLRKELHGLLMTEKEQDDVYGTKTTATEAVVAKMEPEPEPTKEPEPSGPTEDPISKDDIQAAAKAYVQAVHGGDIQKGKAALLSLIHKYSPEGTQLKDVLPEHYAAFYKEVLDI